MSRYQVITYSETEGADEKLAYETVAAANIAARGYVSEGFEDSYDAAIVYDLRKRRMVEQFGKFPDSARPTELNSLCDKCLILGNGCDGTTAKVWTGCVYRVLDREMSFR
ncbi:MAG: hypothetical protein IJA35_04920 [Clostridia bacterium]|nr:hypothetical protein [Clostridia bacterium]